MNEIVLDTKIKKDLLTHIGFQLLQRHVIVKCSKRVTFKFDLLPVIVFSRNCFKIDHGTYHVTVHLEQHFVILGGHCHLILSSIFLLSAALGLFMKD